MKPRYLKLVWFAFVASLLMTQVSCKKETGPSLNELYVYLSPGSMAYNVTGTDSVNILEAGVTKNEWVAFPVFISRPFNRDVVVTAKIDPSLVSYYDTISNSTGAPSPVLNPGSVALANEGKVVIKAGNLSSDDSIRVLVKDPSLLKTGALTHIVPVVLEAASENVPVSLNRRLMFLKLYGKIMSAGISSFGNSNIIRDSAAKSGSSFGGNTLFYVKGILVDKVSGNQTVQIEANNALVPGYGSLTKSSYFEFPANTYQLQKPNATIPAGATASSDSAIIGVTNLNSFEMGKEYLLPLQIKTITGSPQLPAMSNQSIVYVSYKVYSSNLDPRNTGLVGTNLNRTGWSATASSSYLTNTPNLTLDGSTSTYWRTTIALLPASLDVAMTAVKTVKGFNINPPTTTSYSFLTMEVYSSMDGNSWNLEGTFNTPTSSSALKTIKFVNPVTAQYFRFNILRGGGTAYVGIAEINAVE